MKGSGRAGHLDDIAIAVVGAGRMGRGIALSFAYAGYAVALIDSEDRSPQAFSELQQSVVDELQAELQSLEEIDLICAAQSSAMTRRILIHAKSTSQAQLQQAHFIFEAVAEVVDIKRDIYAWLNASAAESAVIASTTSTMLSNSLAKFLTKPQRFLNAHWLNPAHLMPLVELSPADVTDPDVVEALKTLLQSIGKKPVICQASPGFIVSRIQAVALNEAARLVEEGVASAEEVDQAVRIGFGVRYATLGPLEFIDWGGGDILYYASNYLAETVDKQRFSTPDIVRQNMLQNRNGLRDGVGFYDYRKLDVRDYRQRKLSNFVQLLRHLALMPEAAPADCP